jgi:hypothetical protein
LNGQPNPAADTVVFHLVRVGTDSAALERFLASYERFSAGAPHRLVFLIKGYSGQMPKPLSALLDRVRHSKIHCPDRGFDIGSYFYGSNLVAERLAMFTNSFSVLQGDQWLAKMLNAYNRPRTGLVGASGSWESLGGKYLNSRPDNARTPAKHQITKAKALGLGIALRLFFPPFPNIHIRTNGFLIARKEFLAMRPYLLLSKLNAWLFESGRHSMTRQVLARGMEVVVVGRDGRVYRPEEWQASNTFWQSRQENLLIQDNRTLAYERGSVEYRAGQSQAAWGGAIPDA